MFLVVEHTRLTEIKPARLSSKWRGIFRFLIVWRSAAIDERSVSLDVCSLSLSHDLRLTDPHCRIGQPYLKP